jgi:hypothetical protein
MSFARVLDSNRRVGLLIRRAELSFETGAQRKAGLVALPSIAPCQLTNDDFRRKARERGFGGTHVLFARFQSYEIAHKES